ncbi:MAG TPA: peptide ABC transporter substrate-binding protein [Opitutus sp.]|nr:peptide ABC transporter substrate-binding protein [Opitutus sp.]
MPSYFPWILRLSAAVIVVLALAGCGPRESPADAAIQAKTLLLGNLAEPAQLDPQLATAYTDQNITIALFEGLTAIDEQTALPVPAVAESWEISPDALAYTFHLRSDVRWSNGDPLTAHDFVYSVHRILSPRLASEYAYMLWPIKNAEAFQAGKVTDFAQVGVNAIDDRTLQITLERPTPYLLSLAAHPTWFPVHRPTIEKHGAMDQRNTAWTRPGNLVGNGAFTLDEWSPNARVVVTKNSNYWGAAQNQLERVVFFPTDNAEGEERDFRAGQLHVTYGLPVEKIATYRERSPEQLRLDPFLQTFFLRFNVTQAPFDNAKVRRALALAVDREAITRHVLRESSLPALHLTPPNCAGYTARARVATDLDTARRLLAEAGFPGGAGFPVVELQVRNNSDHPRVAEAIQAMWQRDLGVRITIAAREQKTAIQNEQSLNYAISFSGWAGDFADPATFLELFVRDGGNNWTGWGDDSYDQLVQSAAVTRDPTQRMETFQKAEALLLEQAPIAPLFFGARVYVIHPAVKNWQPALLGFHRYQLIRLEP